MGKRGSQPWSRDGLPIGTVRVRKNSQRRHARMIKVAADGPRGRRWITLARHWWLHNRGPIPAGMRVVHRDGDTLNDDPGNYILCGAGDVAYLARTWDPTLDERNACAVAIGTAKCNRDRSRVRRATSYLPGYWYAVDPARRVVVNDPHRSRIALYRHILGASLASANGTGIEAAVLGWPGIPGIDAAVLAAIADGADELPAIMPAVAAIRARYALTNHPGPHILESTFRSSLSRLGQAARVRSLRVPGRLRRVYVMTPAASAERRDPCLWIAVRGAEIDTRFRGATKVWPEELQPVLNTEN